MYFLQVSLSCFSEYFFRSSIKGFLNDSSKNFVNKPSRVQSGNSAITPVIRQVMSSKIPPKILSYFFLESSYQVSDSFDQKFLYGIFKTSSGIFFRDAYIDFVRFFRVVVQDIFSNHFRYFFSKSSRNSSRNSNRIQK